MTRRFLCTLVCLAIAAAIDVAAFSTTLSIPLSASRSASASSSSSSSSSSSPLVIRSSAESAVDTSEDTDEEDVTCYVVNDEEIVTEGEKPHVVCTSEPDDYAWFNGVDPNAMREADDEALGAEECVQGESYKGKPEWECE